MARHPNGVCHIGGCRLNRQRKRERMMNHFTEEDLDACWPYYKTYFVDVLNGEYSLDGAREDLRELIGSKYDSRGIKT